MRVDRALVELVARLDLLALLDQQARAARERVRVLLAAGVRDHDAQALVGLLDRRRALDRRELGLAFGLRASNSSTTRGRPCVIRAGDTAGGTSAGSAACPARRSTGR